MYVSALFYTFFNVLLLEITVSISIFELCESWIICRIILRLQSVLDHVLQFVISKNQQIAADEM